jgi:hypothetical protein
MASLPELSVEPLPSTTFLKHFNAFYATASPHFQVTDVAYIKDGIEYFQQLLVSYPNSIFAPPARLALRQLFCCAFQCTNEIEYLDRVISADRDGVNTANTPFRRFSSLDALISSLLIRLDFLHSMEDVDELMQLFPVVVEYGQAEFYLLPLLTQWALVAHDFGHPSVSTAYNRAMSSMQACLTLGPTLDIQHSQLVRMPDFPQTSAKKNLLAHVLTMPYWHL